MHARLALIALIPVVLGCLNADNNKCASYIKSNAATASSFCASSTKSIVTATMALPAWATNCDNEPKLLSAECSCHYTAAGSSPAPTPSKQTTATPTTITTRTTTAAGTGTAPTDVTTVLPQSSGAVATNAPNLVSDSLDGGMKLYDRSPHVCAEQDETGAAEAMFILEDGATLSNVIIGLDQAEGVHCHSQCRDQRVGSSAATNKPSINVWWQDVCEDTLTVKQTSDKTSAIGGGAFGVSDKIFQFNGFRILNVKNLYAADYGKILRSCGNCSGNGGACHIIMDNALARNGGVLCGINTNYGDTCTISNSSQDKNKTCDKYEGNNIGKEPKKISSGPDDQFCKVSAFTTACAA